MTLPPRLNYDHIAPEYNRRYDSSALPERTKALWKLTQQVNAQRILEVGCGTGFWLNLLAPKVKAAFGLDYSFGMLNQARRWAAPLKLARGDAVHLPYQNNLFDFVYCVDAIHHFGDQPAFIAEAFRVLCPGGALAVLNIDPHNGDNRWYVYDYFEGARELDLQRFPASSTVLRWMRADGFLHISSEIVEHLKGSYYSEDVFNDPFLKKNATSQLALLSDPAYGDGIAKIQKAIANAKARDEEIVFECDLAIRMLTGFKPA